MLQLVEAFSLDWDPPTAVPPQKKNFKPAYKMFFGNNLFARYRKEMRQTMVASIKTLFLVMG